MQRLIQDSIRKILADELLFGKLKNGGSVKIEFDDQSEKIYLNGQNLTVVPGKVLKHLQNRLRYSVV